mgnify:CR=1 FL=1
MIREKLQPGDGGADRRRQGRLDRPGLQLRGDVPRRGRFERPLRGEDLGVGGRRGTPSTLHSLIDASQRTVTRTDRRGARAPSARLTQSTRMRYPSALRRPARGGGGAEEAGAGGDPVEVGADGQDPAEESSAATLRGSGQGTPSPSLALVDHPHPARRGSEAEGEGVESTRPDRGRRSTALRRPGPGAAPRSPSPGRRKRWVGTASPGAMRFGVVERPVRRAIRRRRRRSARLPSATRSSAPRPPSPGGRRGRGARAGSVGSSRSVILGSKTVCPRLANR